MFDAPVDQALFDAVLRKDDETTYAAIDMGPHDNVYRRWNRR